MTEIFSVGLQKTGKGLNAYTVFPRSWDAFCLNRNCADEKRRSR